MVEPNSKKNLPYFEASICISASFGVVEKMQKSHYPLYKFSKAYCVLNLIKKSLNVHLSATWLFSKDFFGKICIMKDLYTSYISSKHFRCAILTRPGNHPKNNFNTAWTRYPSGAACPNQVLKSTTAIRYTNKEPELQVLNQEPKSVTQIRYPNYVPKSVHQSVTNQ